MRLVFTLSNYEKLDFVFGKRKVVYEINYGPGNDTLKLFKRSKTTLKEALIKLLKIKDPDDSLHATLIDAKLTGGKPSEIIPREGIRILCEQMEIFGVTTGINRKLLKATTEEDLRKREAENKILAQSGYGDLVDKPNQSTKNESGKVKKNEPLNLDRDQILKMVKAINETKKSVSNLEGGPVSEVLDIAGGTKN